MRVVAGGFLEGELGTVCEPRSGLPDYVRVDIGGVITLFPPQCLWPETPGA